jgi:hypothetical protein
MTFTLREHLEFAGDSELLRQYTIKYPKNYDEFIDALYEDLDKITGMLESDAKDFIDQNEDQITRNIVRLLKAKNYYASHDHDQGGHVDIHVRSGDQKYSWLCEAKIDRGPAYLQQGLNQLISRYSCPTPGNNHGSLAIYIKQDRAAERVDNWRSCVETSGNLENLVVKDCPRKPGFAFVSEFSHIRTGLSTQAPQYIIRHIGITLYSVYKQATP